MNDENIQNKMNTEDKEEIGKVINECLSWLDGNSIAVKEEFEKKMKEIEEKVNPIMTKAYGAGGPASNEPEIDELD